MNSTSTNSIGLCPRCGGLLYSNMIHQCTTAPNIFVPAVAHPDDTRLRELADDWEETANESSVNAAGRAYREALRMCAHNVRAALAAEAVSPDRMEQALVDAGLAEPVSVPDLRERLISKLHQHDEGCDKCTIFEECLADDLIPWLADSVHAKAPEREIEIWLIRDTETGLLGLSIEGPCGGQRITPRKDTGSWTTVEKWKLKLSRIMDVINVATAAKANLSEAPADGEQVAGSATPRPWRLFENYVPYQFDYFTIRGHDGLTIVGSVPGTKDPEQRANAELIVRAVNAYSTAAQAGGSRIDRNELPAARPERGTTK